MLIKTLASSSEGNCYLISDGSSHLLLECGISLREIRRKGVDLVTLDGCLISHEHKDHCKNVADIAKYTHIYTSAGTLNHLELGAYSYRASAVVAGRRFGVGSFDVIPFTTQHDADEPLGFLIYSRTSKEQLLFATDTYYIHNQFKKLDYIMVECNFDEAILKANIENGLVSPVVAKRLFSSHFELKNVKQFLKATDLSRTKAIHLMHLSDGSSDAERFRREIMELTGVPVYVCEKR